MDGTIFQLEVSWFRLLPSTEKHSRVKRLLRKFKLTDCLEWETFHFSFLWVTSTLSCHKCSLAMKMCGRTWVLRLLIFYCFTTLLPERGTQKRDKDKQFLLRVDDDSSDSNGIGIHSREIFVWKFNVLLKLKLFFFYQIAGSCLIALLLYSSITLFFSAKTKKFNQFKFILTHNQMINFRVAIFITVAFTLVSSKSRSVSFF